MRKLQVSLADFRRLCIFKGIYPRQPRNRHKAAKSATPSTTFYYTKDIQYLLHEPLLAKFREHKALAKKIAKALGKGQDKDAARLERNHAPRMTLDHIVKERYPTFNDALRDLDDALSMLFLFANLPSHMNIPPKMIRLCQRLCHEFQHYLIITHSLRKSFLSIKGIYYQASIQGQDVLWLVPYNFVQRVTGDVDFRIMGTFVEFYTTLVGFVNYRLYTMAGLVYPPKYDAAHDEMGAALDAFTLQARQIHADSENPSSGDSTSIDRRATARAQAIVDAVSTKSTNTTETVVESQSDIEDEEADLQATSTKSSFKRQADDADDIAIADISSSELSRKAADLFKPFVFFLSRETPRSPLEFLIKAFGCTKIGWDEVSGAGAFTHDERDERITHQIVDRPPVPLSSEADDVEPTNSAHHNRGRMPGRTYVQPQWVWDCANACELLRPDLYAPGATLPPHLSPFVKPKEGEYDPSKPLDAASDDEEEATIRQEDEREAQNVEEEDDVSNDAEVGEDDSEASVENRIDTVNGVDSVKEVADLAGTADLDVKKGGNGRRQNGSQRLSGKTSPTDNEFGGFSNASDSDDYQRELKSELAGESLASKRSRAERTKHEQRAKKRKQQEQDNEKKEFQKMLMPRKKRELYDRMAYSKAQKDTASEKLRTKRRKIEQGKL